MSFMVQWLEKGHQTADFPTERGAERFKAAKVAAGVSQVVVFEVADTLGPAGPADPADAAGRDGVA